MSLPKMSFYVWVNFFLFLKFIKRNIS
jgi:hypothetical protein